MNWILLVAVLIIAFLAFSWLVKVMQATISAAITIAIVIIVLHFLGINPSALWQELLNLWSPIWQWIRGWLGR